MARSLTASGECAAILPTCPKVLVGDVWDGAYGRAGELTVTGTGRAEEMPWPVFDVLFADGRKETGIGAPAFKGARLVRRGT